MATLITGEEAAKRLGIPLLAIGQLVYENKLIMVEFDRFDVDAVDILAASPVLSNYK